MDCQNVSSRMRMWDTWGKTAELISHVGILPSANLDPVHTALAIQIYYAVLPHRESVL